MNKKELEEIEERLSKKYKDKSYVKTNYFYCKCGFVYDIAPHFKITQCKKCETIYYINKYIEVIELDQGTDSSCDSTIPKSKD